MISAILDTNVVVQSLISSSSSSSARTLDAYYEGKFGLVYSPAVLDEWLVVLSMPSMRKRHGLNDEEILDFLASLVAKGAKFMGETSVSPKLPPRCD